MKWSLLVCTLLLAVSGCDSPTSPARADISPRSSAQIVNRVANSTAGTDSYIQDQCPECNGIVLWNNASSWTYCVTVPQFDADHDHVDDSCELQLAAAFAPMMYMDPNDGCPQSEPYFAAQEDAENIGLIDIMYMQSYHNDCGTLGHGGDSEFVLLQVSFNSVSGRWELYSMTTSAHWGTQNNYTNKYYASEVWYPAQGGTSMNFGQSLKYPAVYSSKGKHANYRDANECNFATSGDTCVNNVEFGRIAITNLNSSQNVGSRNYMFKDCVFSNAGGTGFECYWTDKKFAGWTGEEGDTPYQQILDAYGWTW